MTYIVVNVDDFGLHPAVSRAVEILGKKGVVTSTTILANGEYINDFKKIASIGFGVHLNILRGKPLSNYDSINFFVDEKGLFLRDYLKLFKRYLLNNSFLTQVELEWSKQIEYLLDLGVKLTHIDSEKHIHAWPGLMEIALDLAKKYSIKWVRRPQEKLSIFNFSKNAFKCRLLNFFGLFYKKYDDISVRWPDCVWGIADQGKNFLSNKFNRYLLAYKDSNLIEIVCHPGKRNENDIEISEEYGKLNVVNQWSDEFDLLSSPEWKAVLNQKDVQLVNYGNLKI